MRVKRGHAHAFRAGRIRRHRGRCDWRWKDHGSHPPNTRFPMRAIISHSRAVMPFRTVTRMFDTLFRQLRRSPTHCAVVIATMAIGIAAASAIFTVVRGVILRPLPYRAPDELVTLQEYQPAMRRDQSGMSYDAFLAFRSRSRALARVSAFSNTEIVLSDGDASERVIGATTDADLFDLLGAHPLAGRSFTAGEDDSAPAHVVILSFRLWQRRYGGDPALLGRSVVLDGEAYTVVGIMPERFEF